MVFVVVQEREGAGQYVEVVDEPSNPPHVSKYWIADDTKAVVSEKPSKGETIYLPRRCILPINEEGLGAEEARLLWQSDARKPSKSRKKSRKRAKKQSAPVSIPKNEGENLSEVDCCDGRELSLPNNHNSEEESSFIDVLN